jgi:hypothetical protein
MQTLHLALYMEDGALGCPSGRFTGTARESAAEHDSGGLWEDQYVPTQRPASHLEDGRLSGTRTAGHHHELRVVTPISAAARSSARVIDGGHEASIDWVGG